MIRRRLSFRFQLLGSLVLAIGIAVGTMGVLMDILAQQEGKRYVKELQEQGIASTLTLASSEYEQSGWETMQGVLTFAAEAYNAHFFVLDPEGRLEFYAGVRSAMPDDFTALLGRPDTQEAPITDATGAVVGTLVAVPRESANAAQVSPTLSPGAVVDAFRRSLRGMVGWVLLGGGFVAFTLMALLSRQVLTPVQRLIGAASKVRQGDFSSRTPVGLGEMGNLARTFNSMAQGLEEAENQRAQLIEDIVHDLRTPLGNMHGYIEAIKDGIRAPDSQTLDAVSRQIEQLRNLVDNLRTATMLESGQFPIDRRLDMLPEVLEATFHSFQQSARDKGVNLRLDYELEFPELDFDRRMMQQVMGNLVQNGILHTSPGGSVTMEAHVVSGNVVVEVRDTGAGIPHDALPHVFERHYRGEMTLNHAPGGSGLGLAISKRIIEAHSGVINIESESGVGTRVWFTLPLDIPDNDHHSIGAV